MSAEKIRRFRPRWALWVVELDRTTKLFGSYGTISEAEQAKHALLRKGKAAEIKSIVPQ